MWKNLPLPVARFIVEKNKQRGGKATDFILFDKPVSLEKVEEAVRRSKGGALASSNDCKAIPVLRQIDSDNISPNANTNRTVVRKPRAFDNYDYTTDARIDAPSTPDAHLGTIYIHAKLCSTVVAGTPC